MMSEYLGFKDPYYENGYYGFPIDVCEGENQFVVEAEMPGVLKEDIHVDFEDGLLTITAKKKHDKNHNKYLIHERNFINMKREINFGAIQEDSLEAKLNDGILTITIHTVEKPKKAIEIL